MRTGSILLLVFGILLVIVGAIFLAFFAIGTGNSTTEDDVNVGVGQMYICGDKMASKIICEYSSSLPINVYVTTDESVKTGFILSIQSLDNVETLDEGNTNGRVEYTTPDSNDKYFLVFENPNTSSTQLHVEVEFQNDLIYGICLIPGIIMLIVGIVLIIAGIMIHKRSQGEISQTPYQAQYSQYPQQYPPVQPQASACPTCKQPLRYINGFWYCDHCRQYF